MSRPIVKVENGGNSGMATPADMTPSINASVTSNGEIKTEEEQLIADIQTLKEMHIQVGDNAIFFLF